MKKDSKKEDDENAALEDFLSGFSFMDEEEIEEEAVEQGPGYDAELYEKIISSALVEFTQRDMDCISKLLSSEIDDNTLKNIKDYAVSNPIKKGPTKTQILEELVTTYSISQNISFTQDDIGILNKLISVEIDSDFITNLKTDPERTKQMYKEIQEAKNIKRKTSEDLTLNVKDMLPDLSVELRKQGDAEIECAVKPVTVFYSEGYDVSKLAITDVLPDLSAEINKKDAYVSKPSAEYQIVDNSYEVERMAINFDLPDLEDVMANPEKYADPEPEKVIVDEEALLKNISNVEFKPFYDGTENFEVLNDIEEVEAIKKREAEELAALFIDLDKVNFKEDEPFEQNDEFQEFYEDEKAEELVIQEIKEEPKEEIVKLERSVKPASPRRERESQNIDLLQKIEQRRQERKSQNKVLETLRENKQKESTLKEERQSDIKCILEGKSYLVVSSVELGENIGCHLAENEDSFAVLSYTGNNLVKIKEYKELKSKKIQARLSETLENGVSRYIVRIGINKFVLDVQDKNIKFVMDLC